MGVLIYFGAVYIMGTITNSQRRKLVLAFFHPYCDGGGGGERVLWVMIHGLLSRQVTSRDNPQLTCTIAEKYHAEIVIYSGEVTKSKREILDNVQKKFGISFSEQQESSIRFVNIYSRFLLEAKWYPVATMVGQSLGSIIVGLECAWRQHPDIFVDTMGAAFMYPLIRCLYSIKIIAYVHYPTISSDMLKKVREQRPSYNNAGRIAQSVTVTSLKLYYYQAFAECYRICGYFADEVMVNSSWTKGHIEDLWCLRREDMIRARDSPLWFPRHLSLVFPPCNTSSIQAKFASDREDPAISDDSIASSVGALYRRHRVIMSLGQFRPEKDHMLQIKAMEEFVRRTADLPEMDDVFLVMFGSTRNRDDDALADNLQKYIDSKDVLRNRVFLLRNRPYAIVEDYLRHSVVGLHTMWNEHFGISVVEMLAAGLITIAHNSGGPMADIIRPGENGFLACEIEEYAELFVKVLSRSNADEMNTIRTNAKESVHRFSDELFVETTVREVDQIINEVF
jgi:alpha-1,2-mannosyltransferase